MRTVLYPHGGSGNHGCEAIVRTTCNIIRKHGIDGEIVLCSDHNDQDMKYGMSEVTYVNPTTINRFSPENIIENVVRRLFKTYSFATKARMRNITNTIQPNNLCLSIGGDNYSYKGFIPYNILRINDIVKEKGCKLVYWGCSIGEDCITKHVLPDLKKYDLIIARESITYNGLIKAGITKNTQLYPDPAFTLDTVKSPLPQGFIEGNTIGLNVSPLIQGYEQTPNITYNNYRNLIQYIIDNTDCAVALIPHVVWNYTNDLQPLTRLYDEFKHTGRVILIDDHNALELKGFISRCRLFIGARTHATIAAYSSCVPTLVIGYSVKAKGIAKDIFGSYENYVLPVQSLDSEDEITNAFKWLMENETSIRKHLKEFIPSYIDKAWQAGEEVKKLLSASS
jgi:polysaccharide pyruvyl transferase WcaK-like protein